MANPFRLPELSPVQIKIDNWVSNQTEQQLRDKLFEFGCKGPTPIEYMDIEAVVMELESRFTAFPEDIPCVDYSDDNDDDDDNE